MNTPCDYRDPHLDCRGRTVNGSSPFSSRFASSSVRRLHLDRSHAPLISTPEAGIALVSISSRPFCSLNFPPDCDATDAIGDVLASKSTISSGAACTFAEIKQARASGCHQGQRPSSGCARKIECRARFWLPAPPGTKMPAGEVWPNAQAFGRRGWWGGPDAAGVSATGSVS